jgi:hypothetical protein
MLGFSLRMDFYGTLGGLFIPRPWLALIPGLIFALLYVASRRRIVGACAAAWVLYGAMEFGNYMHWTCSGECNIRIDLLLIYPVLVLLSAAAAIFAVVGIAVRYA